MPSHKLISLIFSSIFFLNSCVPATNTPFPTLQPVQDPTATDLPEIPITTTVKATPIGKSNFDGVRVNFVYFEGFLITVENRRFLIDAIYGGHPSWVLEPILASQPPFDGIDLILATHEHRDHFNAEMVLQYLQNNSETKFVSTPACVDAILALDSSLLPRLTAIDLKEGERNQMVIDDIEIEAIRLSHNLANVLNLGFIITIGDEVFFHMGDMNPDTVSISDLQAYGLPEKQIDIAFVHHRLFTDEKYDEYITEGIQATYIIPMHFSGQPRSDFESDLPNVNVIWEPYDSWVMP